MTLYLYIYLKDSGSYDNLYILLDCSAAILDFHLLRASWEFFFLVLHLKWFINISATCSPILVLLPPKPQLFHIYAPLYVRWDIKTYICGCITFPHHTVSIYGIKTSSATTHNKTRLYKPNITHSHRNLRLSHLIWSHINYLTMSIL